MALGLFVLAVVCVAGVAVSFRHPRPLRAFQVALFGLLGAGWLAFVAAGVLEDAAIDFTRGLTWFNRNDNPVKFWVSVIFHTSMSVAVLWAAVLTAKMPLNTPLLGFASGDITPKFLGVVRWVFLALAIAVVWGYVSFLLRP